MNNSLDYNSGWATLELVMSLPMIVLVLGLIYYAGRIGFTRLHLTSAVDAGARIAAVKGCHEGENYVKSAFSYSPYLKVRCKTGQDMTVVSTYKVEFPIAVLSGLNQEITVQAHALNEQYDL